MGIILEPRLLFDASVGGTTNKDNTTGSTSSTTADSSHSTTDSTADKTTTAAPVDQSTAAQAKTAASTTSTADAQQTTTATSADPSASKDTSATSGTAQSGAAGATASSTPIDSVLFVDPRVSGWQDLANSVSASTKVVVIDPSLDGITQVTQTLSELHGIKEVDFLTYGQSGQIELGASTVTDASLMANATSVAAWRNSLTDTAQIQFWGCDVGAGDAGAAFVNDLHTLTGVGIAASTDATGAAALNGDWNLERTAGTVTAFQPFSADAEAHFDTVLDAPQATVTLDLPDSVLLGDTYTATLTFTNTAANGVGYAPFVELFVQTNTGTGATEASTLTSATYLGQPVTVTAVTIVDLDGAGPGTALGATNPLLLDSSGHATVVTPPAGFKAGDTMYVLSLPFGSFTPGQPTASITLNFTNDSHSNLTSAHALTMTAIGGYQYGADALNNPGTDPSILDTTHAATDSANVNLINVTTQVNTWSGDGETATGPSYPGTYVFNLTPASAVATDPVNNVDFTFDVPSDVQYNGGTITITTAAGDTGTVKFTPSTTTPGGTLTVHFDHLSGAASISMPFYVPQKDSSNAQVVSTSTDAPTTITLTPAYHYTQISGTQWTPLTGSFTNTPITVADSGTGTTLSFDAKSFAVQVTDAVTTDTGASGFSPGDTVTYSLKFQVSDFFKLDNLVLNDVLGDGMTLDPSVAPVLTLVRDGVTHTFSFNSIADLMTAINGQSVTTTGNNGLWSYAARDGSGQTAIAFDVGALLNSLDSANGGSLLTGTNNGTYGTITFQAKVLDKYTNANSGDSIREKDTTSDSVSGTANVTSLVGGSPTNSITDGDSVTNQEVAGGMQLVITKINGVDVTDPNNIKIQAGDLVTYEMEYDLTTGDYGNLNINGYLPLPVYDVPGTLTAGTGLAANTYSVLTQPTGDTNVPVVTTNATANSVTFDFGTHDSTTNASGQKVVVQFTLQASDKPFADGLALTTQGQTTYTNAGGDLLATAAIKQQTMQEPSLTIKTGVVSVVNDANTNKGTAIYAGDTGSGTTNPTTVFDPATGTGIFVGSPPTTIGDAENQNVSGVDGSDTVRIAETVQNTGHGDAYKITVGGTLPSGYSASDVTNLVVTRADGTTLTYTGDATSFFNGTGIVINGSDGTTGTPALKGAGDASHRDVLFVTYDLKTKSNQTVATTLTAAGTIINFFAAPAAATGFVSGGTVVGGSASNLTDNATITTSSPSFAKTITAGDDSTNVALNNVVVGETITYTFTLTIPEGGMTNVAFNDVMPSFLTNVTGGTVTFGTNVTHTGDNTLTVTGNTVSANFGTVANTNADTVGTITFTVTAKVANSTNVDGTTISNTGTVTSTGIPTLTSTVVATEKDPLVHETLTDNAGGTAVHSGQTVTYTLVLQNDGNAPAQDLLDSITLPAGLTFVTNSITQTGGSTSGVTIDQTGKTISVSQLGTGAGNKLTFTFQATVNNDLATNTALQVTTPATYTSMPGTVTGERSYNATGSDTVRTGVFTPTLVIVDQSNGTATTDGVTAPSQGAPTASTDAVVGEIVRMKVYVEIPEGQNTLDLAVTLPAGLDFLNDGSTTVALASPNGQVLSSTIDPTGTNGAIQVNDTTGFNVATYNPTAAMTSGISVSGNVVHFDFGTVQNNANSTVKNYAIVEFNAVVKNVAGNQSGTALASSAQANGTGATSSDTVNVKEPAVTISKTVTGIDQATGTVTWQVVVTNTGAAGSAPTAYDVNLTDAQSAGAQTNEGTIANLATSGTASGLTVNSGNGTTSLQATMNLAAGASETFTYTTTLVDKTAKLSDSTASVTWTSINSGVASTFYGSSDNATGGGNATAGTTDGERTGADGVGGALNDYDQTATVGLNVVSGNVWNDIGSPLNVADQGLDSTADSEIAGITVTGTWASGSGTVTTNAGGNYSIILPDNVGATVAVPTTVSSYTLVYDTDGTSGSASPNHVEGGLTSGQAKITISAGTAGAYSGVNFAYRTPDTAPVLGTWGATAGNEPTYTVGGAGVTLHTGGSTTVSDTQIDALVGGSIGDYSGTVLTIARDASQGGPVSTDSFGGGGTSTTGLFLSGGAVKYNGTTIGSYTMVSGTLTVTFGTGTSSSDVSNVLNNVVYSTSVNQLASGVLIDAKLTDNNTQSGSVAGNNFQGTGGVKTSNIVTALIDIAPSVVAATYNEPNDSVPTGTNVTAEQGAAVTLAPGITVATGTFSQIELQIGTNYVNGQDVLAFTNTAKVHGAFDAATGKLTLTDQGGATAADWQAALRAVTYYNTSDTPTTASDASLDRSVTIKATSTGGDVVNGTLATVHVVSANDSPILTVGTITIPSVAEDSSAAPTGAVGFLVSTLAGIGTGPNNVTDQDGPAAAADIAVTSVDSTHGTWYFSTDNGVTWNTLTVAAGHARLLNSDARLYFAPNTPTDWNGTISNALTYRAWDQFNGTAGTDVTLPSGLGSGINTPGSAYSSTVQAVNLVVDPVNDAPVASGTASLSTTEDAAEGPTSGSTVTTLFTSNFNDSRDTVAGGSSANTLAGIAITANASTATQGVWRYSTDGGTTWTTIATTGLSDTTAIVLPNTARLEFLPAANWNGTPGGLTVRLIDSSNGAVTFSASSDVSSNGGITPISAATVPLGVTVTAVNDSPVVSGSATSTTIVEDTPSATGDTVSSLIGQGTAHYSDATDTVAGGSTGTSAAGIAITGNASTATQGVWQYSTNGGTTWTDIPTTVSDTTAIVIPTTATLRFNPAANWNGTPGSLTARISDGDTGLPSTGAHNLTGTIGGTGQWSSGTITIGETVTPFNDAPVATGTATLATNAEDTSTPNTNTISTLFGGNFADGTDTVAGGSTANTLAGIAITGDAATSGQGVWRYSLDGGTTWTNVPTSVSNTSALVLPQTAKLEFVPAANFNGTPGGLTVRLIDTSTDVSIPGVGTGLSLSTATTAFTGINVSTNGGTTAISAATVPLATFVSPVNDAPIASGSVTLVTQGSSVTTLFTPSFSDTADQQHGVNSTDGSDANTLSGIAIVGNAANPTTQGVWQYSVDGGTTYTTIPTTLSDGSAIVLPDTAKIQFVGVPGYTGTPGGLTVRVIDTSTDVSIPGVGTGASLHGGTTAYTGIDVSGVNDGGITAVSAATVPFNTIVAGSVSGSYVEPNDSVPTGTNIDAEIAAKVAVNDTVILDQSPTNVYSSATFKVTGNFLSGEDVLAFLGTASTTGNITTYTGGTSVGDITASYDKSTGTLTLSGTTATNAQWQTALRSITYYDSSDTPSAATRTVTMSIVNNSVAQSLGTSTVTVTPVNDSPVLDTGVALTIPDQIEDNSGVPTGAVGFLAYTQVNRTSGPNNVTDPDGPGTTATTTGIAVTGIDTTEGTWYYSTDNGAHWTSFTLSGTQALHLTADSNARLYFQPTKLDWNGTLPNAITFRAWDGFDGVATGTISSIGSTGFGTGVNTAASSYSSAQESLPLTVDAVNDAPVASGSVSLTPVTVGNPPATGTVTTLFGPSFNDSRDTVAGGSTANDLAGIAITGNAATAGQGTWRYSVDGGTTWVDIPTTGLSDSHALVLSKTAMIEFVGTGGFVGTPGALTTRLIDTSTTAIAGVGTGASLATAVTAFADIDVSANGGTTAISANTVPLDTVINAVPTTPFNPPIPPSDFLTQQRDALYSGGIGLGSHIFTGGINTDWLLGENVFRVMEVGIPGVANVSADVFYGTVPKQNLYFEAVNLSGGALPPWLFFDSSTLRFTGTPPEGSEGTIDARVIARDFKGREAVADVHIVIVREQLEILGLLRTSSNDRAPITVPPAPQGSPPPNPGNGTPIIIDGRPAGNPPQQPSGNTPPAGDGAPPQDNGAPSGNGPAGGNGTEGRQGFGLSPQLREFSQAGRLARARSLLNALSAGTAAL